MSPGFFVDCVWENICSAITTLHKHHKLHNTHIKGVKCLCTEGRRETNRERGYMNMCRGHHLCQCRTCVCACICKVLPFVTFCQCCLSFGCKLSPCMTVIIAYVCVCVVCLRGVFAWCVWKPSSLDIEATWQFGMRCLSVHYLLLLLFSIWTDTQIFSLFTPPQGIWNKTVNIQGFNKSIGFTFYELHPLYT